MKRRLIGLIVTAFLALAIIESSPAQGLPVSCGGAGGDGTVLGSTTSGAVGVTGSCSVRSTDVVGPGGRVVLVIDCGYATAVDDHTHWNRQCGPTGYVCPPVPGSRYPHQFLTTLALSQPVRPLAQWCAGGAEAIPSTAALRQEVIRLLTAPRIGIAPATGTALVNLKTLFWIATPTTRDLGPARLIGLPVQLRVNYLHTDFDFGDGQHASLQPGPGTAYDPALDCGTCPTRFGHTYTQPAQITVTAHTYWQAQYRLTGQPWITITGPPITATQPATTTLTINQAHTHLTHN